jgi:hypothetical protein
MLPRRERGLITGMADQSAVRAQRGLDEGPGRTLWRHGACFGSDAGQRINDNATRSRCDVAAAAAARSRLPGTGRSGGRPPTGTEPWRPGRMSRSDPAIVTTSMATSVR